MTATVGDWSDEAINSDNYYDIVKPTADQLAAFGREEDDRIAHVATGETVIPMAVFEEDPALKEALLPVCETWALSQSVMLSVTS